MAARGSVTTPRAFLIFVAVLALAGWTSAWAQQSRYPIKVRLPRAGDGAFDLWENQLWMEPRCGGFSAHDPVSEEGIRLLAGNAPLLQHPDWIGEGDE
jgi:hypothetical protein